MVVAHFVLTDMTEVIYRFSLLRTQPAFFVSVTVSHLPGGNPASKDINNRRATDLKVKALPGEVTSTMATAGM